jgi:rod shape-determining protein MreC
VAAEQRTKVTTSAVALFFVSLFLCAYSSRHPSLAKTGGAVSSEIARPLQFLVTGSTGFVSDLWNNYFALVSLRTDYEELVERTKALEHDKSRLLELEGENSRLRRLLGSVEQSQLEVTVTRVNGYDHSNWVQAISVDRGMRDGIKVGMPVITEEGVVGQVVSVGLSASRILLITDISSGIDAMIQGNRARGIVEGTGQRIMEWRFVLQEDEINVGDRLITSGMDGIYPPGIFIGLVSSVQAGDAGLFKSVEVMPAVNMAALEDLMIVTGIKTPPQVPSVSKAKSEGAKK